MPCPALAPPTMLMRLLASVLAAPALGSPVVGIAVPFAMHPVSAAAQQEPGAFPSHDADTDPSMGRAVVFAAVPNLGRAHACVQCHGARGTGNGSGAFPRLADQAGWYLYKQLMDYASGTRPNPVMTPIARAMTENQMEDVAAYYASLTDTPWPPPPEAPGDLLALGARISANGLPERGVPACAACHGELGRGMAPVYPYLAGQYAAYAELQLGLWKEDVRENDPLGVMEEIAKQLTDREVEAVSLYFASLRPE